MTRTFLRALAAALVFCVTMVLHGCGDGGSSPADDGRLVIATSVPPHAWLVEQIVGDEADVISLISPGDSPHTYQPSDAQMVRISKADVFFRTGISFESGAWFDAITNMKNGPQIVDLRSGVSLRMMEAHGGHPPEAEQQKADAHDAYDGHDHDDHGHGSRAGHAAHSESADGDGTDPHIWLSPTALLIQIRTFTDSLAAIDPAHASEYEARHDALRQQIEQLQAEVTPQFQGATGQAVYVFHPAWGYFTDELNLRQVPIEVEGKQPDDKQLQQLREQAKVDGVRVVFVQPQVTGKAAQAVADSIGARVEVIDPLAPNVIANLRIVAKKMREALPALTDAKKRDGEAVQEEHDHAHEGHAH